MKASHIYSFVIVSTLVTALPIQLPPRLSTSVLDIDQTRVEVKNALRTVYQEFEFLLDMGALTHDTLHIVSAYIPPFWLDSDGAL
ncbi:hypothetical protein YB2330_006036 [Saitoella coloradoensis]